MSRVARSRAAEWVAVLVGALTLAAPAFLLTHEHFVAVAHRAELRGHAADWQFTVARPEPLFFEFEWSVSGSTTARPAIDVAVNGQSIGTVHAAALYLTARARLLAPTAVLRPGVNDVAVRIVGPETAVVDMRLRVLNYYGISPRFPRAAIVADTAAAERFAAMSWPALLLRALIVLGLAAATTLTARALLGGRSRRRRALAQAVPSLVPWVALLYAWSSPLHVWLSPGALALVIVVPSFGFWVVTWAASRRAVVLRLAVVTGFTLLLLEGALRLLNVVYPSSIFYTGNYTQYRGRPGAPYFDTVLNAGGFNDIEHARLKPPGVFRVVALGDSVAFGVVPYAANYLTILERTLGLTAPTEVVNLGVPGTSPQDYLAVLVDEGLSYSPDLVLVNLFVGNDFEIAQPSWYDRSYFVTACRFLWTMWGRGAPAMERFDTPGAVYSDDAPTFAEARFLEIEVDRARIYDRGDATLEPALERVTATLREIRDLARGRGATTLVVVLPAEVQVDAGLRAQVLQAQGSNVDQFDVTRPNRALAAALARDQIASLDLLDVFVEAGRSERLYKPRDTHWNLAGNRLAAERLALAIRLLRGQ